MVAKWERWSYRETVERTFPTRDSVGQACKSDVMSHAKTMLFIYGLVRENDQMLFSAVNSVRYR